jgi:hypothetical protein
VRATLQAASAGLSLNPFGWRQRRQLARYQESADALERVAGRLDAIVRMLAGLLSASEMPGARPAWLAPRTLGSDLGALVGAIEQIVAAYCDLIEDEQADGPLADARARAVILRQSVLDAARSPMVVLPPDGWSALGAILDDLDGIVAELSGASEAPSSRPEPVLVERATSASPI